MCQKSTPQHFIYRITDAIPDSWAPFSSQGGVQSLITHAPLDKTIKKFAAIVHLKQFQAHLK